MNNSKIWLVVNPTVGIPLLLSAVALSSFAVHLAILSKAPNLLYYGPDRVETVDADTTSLDPAEGAAKAAKVADAALGLGEGAEVLITMPDGTTARAIVQGDATVASIRSPDAPLAEN